MPRDIHQQLQPPESSSLPNVASNASSVAGIKRLQGVKQVHARSHVPLSSAHTMWCMNIMLQSHASVDSACQVCQLHPICESSDALPANLFSLL